MVYRYTQKARDRNGTVHSLVDEPRIIEPPTYKLWTVNFTDENGGYAELDDPWYSGGATPEMPRGNYKIQLSHAIYQTKQTDTPQMVIEGRTKAGEEGDGMFKIVHRNSYDSWYGECEIDGDYTNRPAVNRWHYSYMLYRHKKDKVTSDRYVRRIGCNFEGGERFNGYIASLTLEDQTAPDNCRMYFFVIDSPYKPTINRVMNVFDTEADPSKRKMDFVLKGFPSTDDMWVELPEGLFY